MRQIGVSMSQLSDLLNSLSTEEIKRQIDGWNIYYLPEMKRLHSALDTVGKEHNNKRYKCKGRILVLDNIEFVSYEHHDTYCIEINKPILNQTISVNVLKGNKRIRVAYLTWNQFGIRKNMTGQFVRPGNWTEKIDVIDSSAKNVRKTTREEDEKKERETLFEMLNPNLDL
jgi:hypothetical protein